MQTRAYHNFVGSYDGPVTILCPLAPYVSGARFPLSHALNVNDTVFVRTYMDEASDERRISRVTESAAVGAKLPFAGMSVVG